MTKLVVLGAFLRVRQYFIRFGSFFELLFGRFVTRIFIRMKLERHLPESFFYLYLRSVAMYLKYLVIITFIAICHNKSLYLLKCV